jgi:hypothetical protein
MTATIEATCLTPGYRATVSRNGATVASQHFATKFEVMNGYPVSTTEQIAAAYRAAKAYLAQWGLE